MLLTFIHEPINQKMNLLNIKKMKTELKNKVNNPVEEKEEVNWAVVIPILVVMVGLMVAFYFLY